MDDVALVRQRIVEILSELPIGAVLEADSTPTAAGLIIQHQPRLAVLDIQVPGTPELRNGIDLLKWIRINHPRTAVIILSNYDIPAYRHASERLGAVQFLDKSSEFNQLTDVVRRLLGL